VIFLGIGGNLPCLPYGEPRATCGAALMRLGAHGVRIVERSNWYQSAPVPISDQPWFVNAVVAVETDRSVAQLMDVLLRIEDELGRKRTVPNAARTVDLDIIDFHGREVSTATVSVPHVRMHDRAFVLLPLQDIAPNWRHPHTGQLLDELITRLSPDQVCQKLQDGAGVFGTEWTEHSDFDLWGTPERRIPTANQ
jgi:2-amino-4-hydroxy-6-hydroxymethyldihydropteridine diphosphokinase